MKLEKISTIVFCLWSYNDIDNFVPIIWKLSEKTKGQDQLHIKCVIFDRASDYSDDYRIIFIKSLGVEVSHIFDIILLLKNDKERYFHFTKISNTLKVSNPYRMFINYFYLKPIKNRIKTCSRDFKPSLFINKVIGLKNYGLVVFDHQCNPFYSSISEYCKVNNIPTTSIPHGVHFSTSCKMRSWKRVEDSQSAPYPYDFQIYPSLFEKELAIKNGLCTSGQTSVLGAARYSREWISKLSEILPETKLGKMGADKFKIAIMLSKPENRVFQAELEMIISFLSEFPKISLIIKPHTRGMLYDREYSSNVFIADDSIESSHILDWADVVLFSRSSIVLDSMVKRKPVLFLKRVVPGKMVHEEIISNWRVECREDLYDFIFNYRQYGSLDTYTEKERKNCLETFVEPAGKDVLDYYANFFLAQLKTIKEAL